jgi:hypothetical protein
MVGQLLLNTTKSYTVLQCIWHCQLRPTKRGPWRTTDTHGLACSRTLMWFHVGQGSVQLLSGQRSYEAAGGWTLDRAGGYGPPGGMQRWWVCRIPSRSQPQWGRVVSWWQPELTAGRLYQRSSFDYSVYGRWCVRPGVPWISHCRRVAAYLLYSTGADPKTEYNISQRSTRSFFMCSSVVAENCNGELATCHFKV